jgi:DNA modification methylase
VSRGAPLLPDAAVFECYAMMRVELLLAAWRDAGFLPHPAVIWQKSKPVLTHSWFMYDYEPIMVGWQKGHQPQLKPPNNERCVWQIGTTAGVEAGVAGTHPTIKPVELVRRPIAWHTRPGGLIYEPFLGSGTAIIAAEQMDRRCYAMELSPQFVDQAVLRGQRFTGREALRESDGRSFAEIVAAQRASGSRPVQVPA